MTLVCPAGMSLSCTSEIPELWGLPAHTTHVDAFRLNYLMSHCKPVSVLLSYCKVSGFPNRFLSYRGRLPHSVSCGERRQPSTPVREQRKRGLTGLAHRNWN